MSMDGSSTGRQPWVLRTFLVHAVVSAVGMIPVLAIGENSLGTDLAMGVGIFAGGVIGGIASFVYGRRRGGDTVGVAAISAIYPLFGLILVMGAAA